MADPQLVEVMVPPINRLQVIMAKVRHQCQDHHLLVHHQCQGHLLVHHQCLDLHQVLHQLVDPLKVCLDIQVLEVIHQVQDREDILVNLVVKVHHQLVAHQDLLQRVV